MLAPACAFTLGDAIAAAERHSADYAAAVYESKAAQEKPIQARAALLPQVNANVLHQHQPESVSASTRSRGWSIQAEQALFDRGRWLQYKQGKITAQSANFQLRHAASETAFQAARAYFDVLSAQEQLVAVRDERQAFEQQVRQAQAMFLTGAATKIDVQEAMSGYDAAVAKEMAALNRLQLARSTLSEMTGLDAREAEAPAFPSPLPDILQDRPQTYWQENADRNNPELAVQRLAAANARIALSEVRARHLPRLSASAGYQDYHSRQEYGGRGQNYRSRGATVSVQLTLPLFNSGLTVSQSREAAARLNQSNMQVEAAERRIRQAVSRAYLDTVGQWYQSKAQERLLETNRAKFQAAEKGLGLGLSTILQVVQARQAESETQQKLAETRYAWLSSYAELLHHAGLLDGGSERERFARLEGIVSETANSGNGIVVTRVLKKASLKKSNSRGVSSNKIP